MRKIFQMELKRAFINRLFLASLLIGCLITGLQVVMDVIPNIKYILDSIQMNVQPNSVFNSWIGGRTSFFGSIYFLIFPLLAAIPFADSFYSDRKSGYVKNVFTRGNKKNYYIAKFFAVFLSAGFAVTLPLLFNLCLTAMCLPSIIPAAAAGRYSIFAFHVGASIFYTRPYIYVFLYILLIFVVSWILATLSLAFSFFLKFKYVVTLVPFLCFIFIMFQSMFLRVSSLDINGWISPAQSIPLNFSVLIPEMTILLLSTVVVYFMKGMRDDTY